MSRPVRLRKWGYEADITTLARLAVAVKLDSRIPKVTEAKLVKQLDALTTSFVEMNGALKKQLEKQGLVAPATK